MSRLNPIRGFVVATPSDSATINPVPRGFHVNGAGGTVRIDGKDLGTDIDLVVLPGVFYPYQITKLSTTGTTATAITLLY